MPHELLTSAEAARVLGVGTATVKRWTDAGILRCERTAGAHRRFDPAEVARFARAQGTGGVDPGEARLDRILSMRDPLVLHAHLLGERARLGSWAEVGEELGPVLESIGRRWIEGRLTIVEEHELSERIARALSRAAESLPTPPGAPRALLAAAEGDEHTLGLALAELVFREAGWRTVWAGRHVPAAEIAASIANRDLELVALSASPASRPETLAAELDVLGPACRAAEAPLLLGGTGPWPEYPACGRRVRGFAELRGLLAAEASVRGVRREERAP